MKLSLPPLGAFKALEAAARHRSFKKAAEELFVTPAAVSQQIKLLEQQLGFKLFTRYPRYIVLTEKGAELADTVRGSLMSIADKISNLQSDFQEQTLRISTFQSFSMKWLIPRLPGFHRLHPEIDVIVDTTERPVDLASEGYDLAIRAGIKCPEGVECLFSAKDRFIPVYSPKLLSGEQNTLTKEDLKHLTLLTETSERSKWQEWMDKVGLDLEAHHFGGSHSHGGAVVQASVAGQGVGLTSMLLASADVADGSLLVLDEEGVRFDMRVYFVCLPDAATKPHVQAFRKWAMAEIQGMAGCEKCLV